FSPSVAGAGGNPGPRPVRRPRACLASTHSGGVGAPPGGTTAPCQELADGRGAWAKARPPAVESAARRRKENAAVERREARRPASLAGDLRRSGDRPDREAGHGVRRSAPSASRRSAPLNAGAYGDDGGPRAAKNRGSGA